MILYTDKVARANASFTGYTNPTKECTIGAHPDGFGITGKIYGFVVCDTVPNLATVQQWFDNCKTAIDIVDFTTGSLSVWSVRKRASDALLYWNDKNGILTAATRSLTPTLFKRTTLNWGW